MSRNSLKPENLPEKLVWYYIIGTYIIYYLGAQFVLAPLLAYFLAFYLIRKWWNQTEETPLDERIIISPSIWVWIIAIVVIEVVLIIAQLNFQLGITQIISSSIGLSRRWALLALFPLAGCLNIRAKLIYRATCILGLQSLIIILIGTLASLVNIPNIEYISPLKVFGGGNEPYVVTLFHSIVGERSYLFALWSTYLGMLSNIYFWFACQEYDQKWRRIGVFSSVILIIASGSRAAILSIPLVFILVWFLTNLLRPKVHFGLAFSSFCLGILSPRLINLLEIVKNKFVNYRGSDSADSLKLRNTIYRVTIARWWSDARIWGHGLIADYGHGPPITYGIPLGTHHTWLGILYAYGLVGFISLVIAFSWSFIDLVIKAQTYELAKVGLSIIIIMLIFSFSEIIDVFAYIYWPGLVILGQALQGNFHLQTKENNNYPIELYN